jgi:hypothetical protein
MERVEVTDVAFQIAIGARCPVLVREEQSGPELGQVEVIRLIGQCWPGVEGRFHLPCQEIPLDSDGRSDYYQSFQGCRPQIVS